jgi:hypothetical protein
VPDAWFAPPGPVVETRSPRPDPETDPMPAPFAEPLAADFDAETVAMAPMKEPTALDMQESDASPPRDAAFPTADVVAPPVATVAADDAEKWDAIAEEIRMQVLQRIDLFTDTGLREQLGMRLKPIVDRASADLVATINLHVGELLRAYVAEAIEREIENWRNNH